MNISNATKMSRRYVIQSLGACVLMMGVALLTAAQGQAVTASGAWAPVPAASKTETAVFVELENHTAMLRTVVGGSTDMAASVELHQTTMDKNMMKMTPVAGIPVPANGKTILKSGGFHIMVFGLKKPLAVGDSLTLTLKLDYGATIPIKAEVRKQEGMK